MKFLLDMGISPKIAVLLRQSGYDAVHLLDQRLHTLPDPKIMQKARVEVRILLTHDLDFADLLAASGAQLPSVVIFRLRNMRPEQVDRHLQLVIRQYAAELENGAIISVSEGQVRIRQLPV